MTTAPLCDDRMEVFLIAHTEENMGKKPEPLASEVSAKKVVNSKTPVAAVPQSEINRAEINGAEINRAEINGSPSEETVRIGAYMRWDAAGRPGGDGVGFWLEAEQDLLAGDVPVAGKILQKR